MINNLGNGQIKLIGLAFRLQYSLQYSGGRGD